MDHASSKVIAHRGLHDRAPENSLAAIQSAFDAGLTHIEVDVRASADGTLYLLHDARVERTTSGRGRLSRMDTVAARTLRLTDGTPLPRLEEALALARGNAVLCLDVKDADIGARVIRLLGDLGADAEVWSSHPEVVARASEARLCTALISLGVFRSNRVAELVDFGRQLGAHALSFFPADLDRRVIEACREAALPFMCGTPNDDGTWKRLHRQGARAIVTDYPLRCARILMGSPAGRGRAAARDGSVRRSSSACDGGHCDRRKDSVITPS